MAVTPTAAMTTGAALSCAGIVVAATGQATAGGVITLAGWLTFLYGIHRFGRSGPTITPRGGSSPPAP
jgi:hypothetical protein